MKKALFVGAAILFAVTPLMAQDVKTAEELALEAAIALNQEATAAKEESKVSYWNESVSFDLGINTTQLSNWAAGGYNTMSLKTGVDAQANYSKDLMSWGNRLQLDYGFLYSEDKKGLVQKNADRIYFESKWAYRTSSNSKFSYSAALDYRSQFSNTYDKYVADSKGDWSGTLKSGSLSPAYTNIALGIDWVPNDWFNMSIAPLTGGLTICTIKSLRPTYGMPVLDESTDTRANCLFQFGAQVKANFRFVVNDVLKFESQAVVFTDYLSEPYFRVNWDNSISWQLSKFFSLNIKTWNIYDPNVTIDGTKRVQFKDFVVLGFNYTIRSK